MLEIANYFKGKKITVMGLGLLGRGLGDALFLAECGAELIVTDLKTAEQLEESAALLRPYPNVQLVLGEHRLEDFTGRDFILVAAGVPQHSPYLACARSHSVPLKMSAAWLAELSELPVIGVTGTRGKSTVTHLIYHTLVQSGVRALLGGNVRGVSNLQLFKQVEAADVLVMELDSWQLQGFGWFKMSPHIAVFTNFMEDHLNYYDSMDAYFADKANIYKYQKPGDVLIAEAKVAEDWIADYPPAYSLTVPEQIPSDWQLLLPGEHNRVNVSLAAAALQAFGLDKERTKRGCETFGGVEGRLQFLRRVDEVEIYNDNNATTPAATISGLRALGQNCNVVLIIGGTNKGVDVTELATAIGEYAKYVILYAGTGTEVLKQKLDPAVPREEYTTLAECVAAAKAVATADDVILFSPAFSSFGKEYKNEYDRNDQFVKLIDAL